MEGGGGGGGRGRLCSGRVSFARSRSLPGAAGGAREGQPVRLEALARSASGSGRAERATTKEKGDAPAVTVVRRAARGERHGEGAQSSSAQAHGGGRSEGTRRGGDGARRGVSPLDLDDDSSQEGATGTGRTRERCQTALKWLRAYSGPASRERGARWWIDESKGERRARACRALPSRRSSITVHSLSFAVSSPATLLVSKFSPCSAGGRDEVSPAARQQLVGKVVRQRPTFISRSVPMTWTGSVAPVASARRRASQLRARGAGRGRLELERRGRTLDRRARGAHEDVVLLLVADGELARRDVVLLLGSYPSARRPRSATTSQRERQRRTSQYLTSFWIASLSGSILLENATFDAVYSCPT